MPTGRAPYTVTDIAPYGSGTRRLRPPASLSEPAKRAFLDLVAGCTTDHFRPADIPLMCRWAELAVMCEAASVELEASTMLDSDGKPSPWLA